MKVSAKHLLEIRGATPIVAEEIQSLVSQLQLIPGFESTTQTTVGAAGAASALPATPSLYLTLLMPNTGPYAGRRFVLPLYEVD